MRYLLRSWWALTCRVIPLVLVISCLMVWLLFTFFKPKVYELGLSQASFGMVVAAHFGCCVALYFIGAVITGMCFYLHAAMVSRRLRMQFSQICQAYFELGLSQLKPFSAWTVAWVESCLTQYKLEQQELTTKRSAFLQRYRASGEFIDHTGAS